MKIGYFDTGCGASGDMIVASLLDAGLSVTRLKKELKKIPLTGYCVSEKTEERNDPAIGHSRPVRRLDDMVDNIHAHAYRRSTSVAPSPGPIPTTHNCTGHHRGVHDTSGNQYRVSELP
jgi:hypothetical protein